MERRDFPLTFNHEELNEEDASLIRNGNMAAVPWTDKRVIYS